MLGMLVLVVIARANRLITRYLSVVKFLEGKEEVVGRGIGRFSGNIPI
jgi:hypothetical protein